MASEEVDELDLLRAEYSKALTKNNEAKALFREVLDHSRSQAAPRVTAASPKSDRLTTHLDALRLQRQHDNLQTLAQYSRKADEIADELKLYEPLDAALDRSGIGPRHKGGTMRQEDLAKTQQRVDDLLDSAQSLSTNLELALVRARQQLKREQSLLEYAKAQSHNSHDENNAMVELKALEATRDELQTWIGDSLAACEQEVTIPNAELLTASDGSSDQTTEETGADVETEYERYIEARKRLLSATHALRSPLLEPTSDTPTPPKAIVLKGAASTSQTTTTQRPPHIRHKSQASTSRPSSHPPLPSLAEIQSTHLPDYHHEKILTTYTSHLKNQTATQDAGLLQVLSLLSHESHLLPAHPMSNIAQGQAHGESESGTSPNAQQAEISRLLMGWDFASKRAGDVLGGSVEGQVRGARGSLDRARGWVEEMRIVEGMRREVRGRNE